MYVYSGLLKYHRDEHSEAVTITASYLIAVHLHIGCLFQQAKLQISILIIMHCAAYRRGCVYSVC